MEASWRHHGGIMETSWRHHGGIMVDVTGPPSDLSTGECQDMEEWHYLQGTMDDAGHAWAGRHPRV